MAARTAVLQASTLWAQCGRRATKRIKKSTAWFCSASHIHKELTQRDRQEQGWSPLALNGKLVAATDTTRSSKPLAVPFHDDFETSKRKIWIRKIKRRNASLTRSSVNQKCFFTHNHGRRSPWKSLLILNVIGAWYADGAAPRASNHTRTTKHSLQQFTSNQSISFHTFCYRYIVAHW